MKNSKKFIVSPVSYIPVIYFHSIGPKNPLWVKNYLTCPLHESEEFLKYVSNRYRTIHLKEYWEQINGLKTVQKDQIIITFDDGYLDVWLFAFQMLKKYNLKATIFISPDFVDQKSIVRNNLNESGFLSWNEMKIMENSGLIDIQSHTLTHTKYFVSDKIVGFHHPGADIIYPVGNIYPDRKPYYINNSDFEKLLPYGYPLFEEKSSLIARIIFINPDFTKECILLLKDYDFSNYQFDTAYRMIERYYNECKRKGLIIMGKESNEEYLDRVRAEISESKKIIEQELNKKVEFLCWPHGDNNKILHQMALDAGYLMTTIGKDYVNPNDMKSRIPNRLGISFSSWNKKLKTIIKLKLRSGKVPFGYLLNAFHKERNHLT